MFYPLLGPPGVIFTLSYAWIGRSAISLWLYGLATGQGITAKVFSSRFFAETLSPAAYSMYLLHLPISICWLIITRAVTYPLTGVAPDFDYFFRRWEVFPLPVLWWEFPFLTSFISWACWYYTLHWSEKLSARFQQIFDRGYCWCCCLCSGVGILCWKPEDVRTEADTMLTVLDSISSLTGADADATSKLTDIGLDSFGAGALVGILVSRLPGLLLRAVDIYELATVGDLVALIDSRLSKAESPVEV